MKPKVAKKSRKPVTRVKECKPTPKQAQVKLDKDEKDLEVEKVETFPVNKPVGTTYIPTGSKSRWIKQEDEKWKEVKDEG